MLRKSSETMVALAEDHMNDGELYVPAMSCLLDISRHTVQHDCQHCVVDQ